MGAIPLLRRKILWLVYGQAANKGNRSCCCCNHYRKLTVWHNLIKKNELLDPVEHSMSTIFMNQVRHLRNYWPRSLSWECGKQGMYIVSTVCNVQCLRLRQNTVRAVMSQIYYKLHHIISIDYRLNAMQSTAIYK